MKKLLFAGLFSLSLSIQAQVNTGFETWNTTLGYAEPTGWVSSNFFTLLGLTDSLSCFKSSSACNSAFSARLRSFTVDFGAPIIAPGTLTQIIPIAKRPKTIRYCYSQFNAVPDTAFIEVLFYKGSTDEDTNIVGQVQAELLPSKALVNGTATIDWLSSATPDTAIVTITSGNEGKTSELIIDNFSMSDFASGISDVKPMEAKVYAGANGVLVAEVNEPFSKTNIHLVNLNGQEVFNSALSGKQNLLELPNLPAGLYAWTITSTDGITHQSTGKIYIP